MTADDVDDDAERLLGGDDDIPESSPPARAAPAEESFAMLFHGIHEPLAARVARICAPSALFARGEMSGALGDLGTFLPDVVALSSVAGGFPPAPFVFWSGVWSVWTGVLFDLPMPVQPMHAVVAVAVTEGLTYAQIAASGVWLGLAFLALGRLGLVGECQRRVPLPVVRALQLGLGLKVVCAGAELARAAAAAHGFAGGANLDGWGLALAAGALALALYGDRERPASVALFALGLVGVAAARPRLALGLHAPLASALPIAAADWGAGLYRAALPQLPVTLLNAVIATAKLADDLYPKGDPRVPVPVGKIALSIGAMNAASACAGHFPSCHGCGGLAAQHHFGARAGSSMVLMGAAKMALAVALGPSLLTALAAFPRSVLGVLLAVGGVELAVSVRDMERRDDVAVMLIGAGVVIQIGTGAGFVAALAAAKAFELRGRLR